VVTWAGLGVAVAFVLLLLDVRASGEGITRLIRPGTEGPSIALVREDFPSAAVPDGVGLDGQQFYAIARNPWHPDEVAPHLTEPRYRYGRPLYPLLAWALHPVGGGRGLVLALVGVNLAAGLLGGVALGWVAARVGAPAWLALLYPLLPGTLLSTFASTADALAVALALVTVAAALHRRLGVAVIAAVLAVLARETTALVPLALVLAGRPWQRPWRRPWRWRREWWVLVAPAVVLVAWLVVVRLVVPGGNEAPEQLGPPLAGLVDAVRARWLHGKELIGMASTVTALVVGVTVLFRRLAPVELRLVVAVQLAFLILCSGDVLGNDFGGTRSTLTLLAVAIPALVAKGSMRPAPAPAPS
jgi:hypothetical protein